MDQGAFLATLVLLAGAFGQELDFPESRLAILRGDGRPLGEPLAWIQREQDLDPSLDEGARRARIRKIARESADLPFSQVEIPVDLRRIQYLGCLPAKETAVFADAAKPEVLFAPDDRYHVYAAPDLVLLSRRNDTCDQLLLHSVLRALLLLELRTPDLWRALFAKSPELSPDDAEAARSRPWINLRRRVVVIVGRGPDFAASSLLLLGREERQEIGGRSLKVYWNQPCILLDVEHILDRSSRVIYQRADWAENFIAFCHDGLIEALVHESLHNLILEQTHARPEFGAIRQIYRVHGDRWGRSVEEAAVCLSSIELLESQAPLGISPEVREYYKKTMFEDSHLKLLLEEHRRSSLLAPLIRDGTSLDDPSTLFRLTVPGVE